MANLNKELNIIQPHGGKLINRIVPKEKEDEFRQRMASLKMYRIDAGDASVFHRIADGTLSPLEGPMCSKEFYNLLDEEVIIRDGRKIAWTIPIAFSITNEEKNSFRVGEKIAVFDPEGEFIGSIIIEDIFSFDKKKYLGSVYGTERIDHPGAKRVISDKRNYLIGGKIFALPQKNNPHFGGHIIAPAKVRDFLKTKGWERAIAFQTRNPLHRAHEYVMVRALEKCIEKGYSAAVALNPLVGETKSDDVSAVVRMKCYEKLIFDRLLGLGDSNEALWKSKGHRLRDCVFLVGLDMKMFYAGPKEAVMHAIYRQNMGFTDIIIGRRHADAPYDNGEQIWDDFDAQEKFDRLKGELLIKNINMGFAAYFNEISRVGMIEEYNNGWKPFTISGSKIREMLISGEIPDSRIMRPEIAAIIIEHYRQKKEN